MGQLFCRASVGIRLNMFQIPAPTRFDLRFPLFGVPVRVHPLFWLLGIFIGYRSGDLVQLLIWVGIIFVSILLHEFGHSMAMRVFGSGSYIVLYMFGGLAVPTSSPSRSWIEQVIISLAGPFAGFLLVIIVLVAVVAAGGFVGMSTLLGFIPFPYAVLPNGGIIVNSIIGALIYINVFWGLINLLPVFPLDGGQTARAIFVRFDPWNGVTNALWLSVITGAVVAVAGFVAWRSFYMAFLFGMLALQSYQALQHGGGRSF